MKLKTRLYLGFSVIIFLMITLSAVIVGMLGNQYHKMNFVVTDRYQKVKYSYEIRFGTATIQTAADELTTNLFAAARAQRIRTIDESEQSVVNAVRHLQSLSFTPRAQQAFANIQTLYNTYGQTVNELVSLNPSSSQVRWMATLKRSQFQSDRLFQATDKLIGLQSSIMDSALSSAGETYHNAVQLVTLVSMATLMLGLWLTVWVIRGIAKRLGGLKEVMATIMHGAGQYPRIALVVDDEIGELVTVYNQMAESLELHEEAASKYRQEIETQNWIQTSVVTLSVMSQGYTNLREFGHRYIRTLAPLIGARYGVLYVRKTATPGCSEFVRLAAYALSENLSTMPIVRQGEGLVGQAVQDKQRILIHRVPREYIKIRSALGEASPASILIEPIQFEGDVIGVLEFATFDDFSSAHLSLLEQARLNLGTTLNRIERYLEIQQLLQETQTLNEELQAQSEELQVQQEELRTMNDELNAQYKSAEQRARELDEARIALEQKAQQVSVESQYKSEFLANMSHELRTPLNSLLILAQLLNKNQSGNLTPEQVEYANVIFSSGNDLLMMINDILDLAKIEAGQLETHEDWVEVRAVCLFAKRQFTPVAHERGLDFRVTLDQHVPRYIYTDEQRLLQILKNLLSNAFKFTEQGYVELHIRVDLDSPMTADIVSVLFSVIDSGIGISSDKHGVIFEAFKQADGKTNRKYGGTGLGLSISAQLAERLGGTLHVQSKVNQGSTFTFHLPCKAQNDETALPDVAVTNESASTVPAEGPPAGLPVSSSMQSTDTDMQDRAPIFQDRKVLIVDDDMRNAFALTGALEALGCDVTVAEHGKEALQLLTEHGEVDLILMDIMMPEMDGYEAMARIRQIPRLKSVPIIALTAKAMKSDRQKCIEAGASDYISKPVQVHQLVSLLRVWLYQ